MYAAVGALAGFAGALVGLGGGVIVVPGLILMGIDVKVAVVASLFSTLSTWSAATRKHLQTGMIDLKAAFLLGCATSIGAILGSRTLLHVPPRVILLVFAAVLVLIAFTNLLGPTRGESGKATPLGYVGASLVMLSAGFLSALLGIGAGAFKVFAMDRMLKLPYRKATATSSFLIGITAASGALYHAGGPYFKPHVAVLVSLGSLMGAILGSRVMYTIPLPLLRLAFSLVVILGVIWSVYRALNYGP